MTASIAAAATAPSSTVDQMRQEILITCKANNVRISDDTYLALLFRTESELRHICAELSINTRA